MTATAKEQNFSFKGYESGAVDFLLKPLDAHAVKSKVQIFIELFRQKKELKVQLGVISELVKDLNDAKNEAERANASKTQFLANMSHEIRTPLGAILGFADLMKTPSNSIERNRDYMVIVERNSQQLLRLLDDILDLSKVEAGKMVVENIQFSLAEMLTNFIPYMVVKAEEKGIEFKFTCETLIPDFISSDPFRLRQILTNIVGNAIKFTNQGYVQLTVAFNNPTLQFTVRDTGIGLSKNDASKLFQSFSQADASNSRKFGGTGLGLALSRRLAVALGGKLEILESKKGEGSSFLAEVNSPLLPNAKLVQKEALIVRGTQPNIRTDSQILCGLKVLLIEDSPDNQMIIKMFLENEGALVTSASDGIEGVEVALIENFDVLLMDIQMPKLDGHEATRKLRSGNFHVPIIALTAHAMKEERVKCFESGFTEFLTKPIQRDILIETLSRYVPGPLALEV